MAATAVHPVQEEHPAGEHLPEYETVSHFGALNGIASLSAIVKSNTLCNELGMDTISAARDRLQPGASCGGRFPAGDEVPGLLEGMAARRGDGELLSLGSRRVAEALGSRGSP